MIKDVYSNVVNASLLMMRLKPKKNSVGIPTLMVVQIN